MYEKRSGNILSIFELEKDRLIQKTNHELNLKVLSLICDSVLLPPSHLLELSLSSLDFLKAEFKLFFDNQTFTTSVGSNQTNLNEFYFEKRLQSIDWNEIKERKSCEIIELFSNTDYFRKRDITRQSFVFYEQLKDLILTESEYINNVFTKRKINILETEIDKILNKKGFFISKKDFDNLIDRLKENRRLLSFQHKILKDFSNSAYYYAGGLGNNSIIGHSSYFQSVQINLLKLNTEYSPIILYNPSFFCDVLKKIKVIESDEDILKLSPTDIHELRQSDAFEKFILQYNKFSEICQQTIDNENFRNTIAKSIDLKIKTYKWAFSFSSFISTLGLLVSQDAFILSMYLLGLLESYISNFSFSKKFYAKTIDKVRSSLVERIDPFTGFCLNIERIIKEIE